MTVTHFLGFHEAHKPFLHPTALELPRHGIFSSPSSTIYMDPNMSLGDQNIGGPLEAEKKEVQQQPWYRRKRIDAPRPTHPLGDPSLFERLVELEQTLLPLTDCENVQDLLTLIAAAARTYRKATITLSLRNGSKAKAIDVLTKENARLFTQNEVLGRDKELLTKEKAALKALADRLVHSMKALREEAEARVVQCTESAVAAFSSSVDNFVLAASIQVGKEQAEKEKVQAEQMMRSALKEKDRVARQAKRAMTSAEALDEANCTIDALRRRVEELEADNDRATDSMDAMQEKINSMHRELACMQEELRLKHLQVAELMRDKAKLFVGQLSYALASRMNHLQGGVPSEAKVLEAHWGATPTRELLTARGLDENTANFLSVRKQQRNAVAHPSVIPDKEALKSLIAALDLPLGDEVALEKALQCLRALNMELGDYKEDDMSA